MLRPDRRPCADLRPIDHIVLIAKNYLNGQSDYNTMIEIKDSPDQPCSALWEVK
jgi:hypothetical protein